MKNLLLFISILSLSACSAVGPGQRGIRVILGSAQDGVLNSGPHFWLPFIFGIEKFDVQVQKSDVKTSSSSRDMQEVSTEVVVNWSLDPNRVIDVYRNVGDEDDIYTKIIAPAVAEIMKASTAKLTAEEIITKRLDLKKDIDEGLRSRLAQYGVNPTDVSIVNLSFSSQFTQAIEDKQIAEQKAKQAEYTALQAIQQAKAEVNRAKGQAESQQLLRTTLTKEILQQRAIEKWDGHFPQFMGSQALPFINFTPSKGE